MTLFAYICNNPISENSMLYKLGHCSLQEGAISFVFEYKLFKHLTELPSLKEY